MTVWRKIAGVALGVVATGLVIAAVEGVGHQALSSGTAFAAAIGGYALGVLIGTLVAQRIADRRWSLTVPVTVAILATINFFAMPHPVWFAPAAGAAIALGWIAGSRMATR